MYFIVNCTRTFYFNLYWNQRWACGLRGDSVVGPIGCPLTFSNMVNSRRLNEGHVNKVNKCYDCMLMHTWVSVGWSVRIDRSIAYYRNWTKYRNCKRISLCNTWSYISRRISDGWHVSIRSIRSSIVLGADQSDGCQQQCDHLSDQTHRRCYDRL